jgi:hypothetical protein
MWLGNVLTSEEFAPDAGRTRRRVRWRIVGALVAVVGVAVACLLVWRSRPKASLASKQSPGLATPTQLAAAVPAQAAAPPANGAHPSAAVVPPSAAAAGVAGVPSEPEPVKTAHAKKLASKHKKSKRHPVKTAKSSKHRHSKVAGLSRADAK